jgi:dTDP-4-amino-4,6-dideoxygalactose transaminase
VFADIDPVTLNIDPAAIEAAITPATKAILATHVFGNPCDIEGIDAIAKKHGLKVLYDATHAFGTTYKGKSIFLYGDVSITSFHATKLFHTVEGGAVFTKDAALLKKMARQRNFGYVNYEDFDGAGINAKNSEFHAAMGLCNLKYLQPLFARRKEQWIYYLELLKGLNVQKAEVNPEVDFNYAYFPVIFPDEAALLESMKQLQMQYVYPRRYFYPALNNLNYVTARPCPVAESIAQRVLCLPLFHDLRKEEQQMIARILLRVQNN